MNLLLVQQPNGLYVIIDEDWKQLSAPIKGQAAAYARIAQLENASMTERQPYGPKTVTDPWWLTEQGIKARYAEQREEADKAHQALIKRINDEELQALAAFDAHLKDKGPSA